MAGDDVASAQSDHNGDYTISGLAPGSYTVSFDDQDGYLEQSYNDASGAQTPDPVTVAAGQVTGGVNAVLGLGGSIRGRVTDAVSHTGVAGAQVEVISGGDYVGDASTDSSGSYTVAGLPAGSYTVQFVPPQVSPYAAQFYPGSVTASSASPVSVADDQTTNGINAVLTAQGALTGSVTDAASGAPVTGATVQAFDGSGNVVATATATQVGRYVLGLGAGSYRVEFEGCDCGDNYAPQFSGGGSSLAGASSLPVASSKSTVANAALTAGGEITGTVTDAVSGDPLDGIEVDAYSGGTIVSSALTSISGQYTIGGLASGSYTVGFAPSDDEHAPQFYDGTTAQSGAQLVRVTAGSPTRAIDAALTGGGTISGKVTDSTSGLGVGGLTVAAVDAAGDSIQQTATAPDGSYSLGGLTPGSYRVLVSPQWPSAYSDHQSGEVSVTAGSTATGVNVVMEGGGAVAGTVTDAATGRPIAGATVELYDDESTVTATTTSNGGFVFGGVGPGIYFADFTATAGGYLTQYYDDSATDGGALPIFVTAGQVERDVDASLQSGGHIKGVVSDAQTQQPVANIEVDAYDSTGTLVSSAQTGSDGSYSIAGLSSGRYTVGFAATGTGGDYLPSFYEGASSQSGAQSVSVTDGGATGGIDASLSRGGTISGVSTSAASGKPVDGGEVTIYDTSDDYVASTSTAADGSYSVAALPTGTYEVGFSPGSDDGGDLSTYYGGATLAGSQGVSVTAGQTKGGIDGALPAGGSISGTVTDAGLGSPLNGVQVEVYDADDDFVGSATTDATGTYTVAGLSTGAYTVSFTEQYGNDLYAQQWYDDASSDTAKAVQVTNGQSATGIDAALVRSGVIEGVVTAAGTGDPVGGVQVDALDSDGDLVQSSTTAADGTYSIGDIAPGTYEVEFSGGEGLDYAPQYYPGAASYGGASPVQVSNGAVVSGLDATLQTGGEIAGTVTDSQTGKPIQNVDVYGSAPDGAAGVATTDAEGHYLISGLPSGDFTVHFSVDDQSYLPQYYGAQTSNTGGNDVTVTAGSETQGIDSSLVPSAQIEGTATGANAGHALAGVAVAAYNATGDQVGSGQTDVDGAYDITGLAAGSYTVKFLPDTNDGQNYVAQYYDSAASEAAAKPLTLSAGQAATGIDAALQAGGEIAGSVTDAATGADEQDIEVVVYDHSDALVASTDTDSHGNYAVAGLPSGSYEVAFDRYETDGYVEQYDDHQWSLGAADPVAVTAGQLTKGIDAALGSGRRDQRHGDRRADQSGGGERRCHGVRRRG